MGPYQELRRVLHSGNATADELKAFLDALDSGTQQALLRRLRKADQQKIWQISRNACPISINDFVPEETPPATPIVFRGKNTLCLFRHFTKSFYHFMDGERRVVAGANFQRTPVDVGPGYFTLHSGEADKEALVDYSMVPNKTDPRPEGWREVASNDATFWSRLVFGSLKDRIHRVSDDFFIGQALKRNKPTGLFTLCREKGNVPFSHVFLKEYL